VTTENIDNILKFNFEATGVGSVPFKDPKTACRLIFENFHKIPFWPQLPKRSFRENMYLQYSERIPGLVLDENAKTIHIDTSRAAREIEKVYEKYIEGDLDFFEISKDRAEGLYEFIASFRAMAKEPLFVKGQITGPASFALSVTDENKRSIIYDKELYEAVTKLLAMKARWQIRKLKELCPRVIMFVDEPYLVSIGSSYVNIDADAAVAKIDEIAAAIRSEGALAAVHCCGNTDWSLLLKRDIDMLNFDAYNFINEFSLYADDIKIFLQKGGTIAWGIIPSSEAIEKESDSTLLERLKGALKVLAARGIDESAISSIITPSCGTGSLDEARARKILESAARLSKRLTPGGK